MEKIFEFKSSKVKPQTLAILAGQGMLSESDADERIKDILNQAIEMYTELAQPIGIVKSISIDNFAVIYSGMGLNEVPSPVADIYPRKSI